MASIKLGLARPCKKNIYFVVLDLHTTDRDKIIQLFKDWTDYSAKLVEGELVKRWPENASCLQAILVKQSGLTLIVWRWLLVCLPVSWKRWTWRTSVLKCSRDLPPFPKEQLREKYTGGDIVIQACADDEQVAFHAIPNLIRKGRSAVTLRWSQSGFAAIPEIEWELPRNLFGFKDGTANQPRSKTLTTSSGLIVRTGWEMVLIWQFVGFQMFLGDLGPH